VGQIQTNPIKENVMKISARNIFEGKITSLVDGKVNAEVEVTTAGGDRIVAVVTESSVQSLGLALGKPVLAFVKAPWVIVMAGDSGVKFSARNQLSGTVQSIDKGAINSEIRIKLNGGTLVYAVITNEAVMELGLKPGVPASALIKASHVVLGVPESFDLTEARRNCKSSPSFRRKPESRKLKHWTPASAGVTAYSAFP
jgi:molybdate transport system regulatory protein